MPWVQYDWVKPVSINKVEIYWAIDAPRPRGMAGSEGARVAAPASYQVSYWNGSAFVPVSNPKGLESAADTFNTTQFDEVKTDKLRLEVAPQGEHAAGVLEWRVFGAGSVPALPPVIHAGLDRSVVLGGADVSCG